MTKTKADVRGVVSQTAPTSSPGTCRSQRRRSWRTPPELRSRGNRVGSAAGGKIRPVQMWSIEEEAVSRWHSHKSWIRRQRNSQPRTLSSPGQGNRLSGMDPDGRGESLRVRSLLRPKRKCLDAGIKYGRPTGSLGFPPARLSSEPGPRDKRTEPRPSSARTRHRDVPDSSAPCAA